MYEKQHNIHKGDLKRGIRHVAISTAGGSNTYLFVLQEATTSCSSSPEYPTLHYYRQSIPTDFRLWSNYRWVYWPKVPAQFTYQSSSGGQPSSKASCPAIGLALARQQSSRISCPVQINQLVNRHHRSAVRFRRPCRPFWRKMTVMFGRMYQHLVTDKGPQNPKKTGYVGLYFDKDSIQYHIP